MYSIAINSVGNLFIEDLREENSSRDGFRKFTIKVMSPSSIEIFNPIETSTAYYLTHWEQKILIEDQIGNLPLESHADIDLSFVIRCIQQEDDYDSDTIWRGIKRLLPGSIARISCTENEKLKLEIIDCFSASIFPNNESPMIILAEELSKKIAETNSSGVAINYSGGRDSTGLLVAAKSLKDTSVSAFTWIYDRGSAHEDFFAAQKQAVQLKTRHYSVNIDPNDLFIPPTKAAMLPGVSTAIAFQGFRRKFYDLIASKNGPRTLVLDGHGGDHVYLDPVPWEIIDDRKSKLGALKALKTAIDLSHLNGTSIFNLWNIRKRQSIIKNRHIEKLLTPAALEISNSLHVPSFASSKEIHHKRIKQAVLQNSTAIRHENLINISPFTSSRIIGGVWNTPVENFFNSRMTRLPFRKSFDQFQQEKIPLRIDKGHITGAYQHALRKKMGYLIDISREGVLNKSGMLNFENFLTEFSKSSLGYNGVDPIILKIICFELMLSAI